MRAGGGVACRLERAVAVAPQHTDGVAVEVRRDQIEPVIIVEVARLPVAGAVADSVVDRREERRHTAVFQDFEVWPVRRVSMRCPPPATAFAWRQGGSVLSQPTGGRHGSFSISGLVCGNMAIHLPGAQTGRRGGAGLA